MSKRKRKFDWYDNIEWLFMLGGMVMTFMLIALFVD